MSVSAFEKAISPADADRLIAAHDAEVALLYLYRARTGCEDLERSARDLCRTLREIEAADEKLRRMGLFGTACAVSERPANIAAPADAARVPSPAAVPVIDGADELPEYRAEDISRRTREDPLFAAVLSEARKVMGRNLSSVDIRVIFAAYDYLGLPADVMMMLINYCGELYTRKYGAARRPTAKALRREAGLWRDMEIMSIEQAERYIEQQSQRESLVGRIKEVLGIRGRELSRSESEYVESWIELGFGPEELAVAYDRTLLKTGALKWSYMNRILLNWKEKGLMTVKDIDEKDGRSRSRPQSAPAGTGSRPADLESLTDILKQI